LSLQQTDSCEYNKSADYPTFDELGKHIPELKTVKSDNQIVLVNGEVACANKKINISKVKKPIKN